MQNDGYITHQWKMYVLVIFDVTKRLCMGLVTIICKGVLLVLLCMNLSPTVFAHNI